MPNLPYIHLIHASDAPRHSGKLKEILQRFKTEKRIADYATLSPDSEFDNLINQVKNNDLVLTLLTHELEPRKEEIESMMRVLKTSHPEVEIAEIIVDHVPYEIDFITFPSDLKPVRGREDMDAAWNDIEQNLKDMFPPETIQEEPQNDQRKKYMIYAIPGIVLIALLLWWIPSKPKPDNGADDLVAEFTANTTACEAPCEVSFDNTSKNFDAVVWSFGDGTTSSEANPSHIFDSPGNYTITLVASKDGHDKVKTQIIKVTEKVPEPSPPVADFSSNKTSCEAPCKINFSNASQNADDYFWTFGDGNSSREKNPSHTYSIAGNYTVKLTVVGGGKKDQITSNIIILPPFTVTNVSVEVSGSNNISGACPHRFDFKGKIAVNKAGTVRYTWLNSNGETGPVQTLNFSEAGAQTISTSWPLGSAGKTYNNMWQQVKIIEPSEMVSNRAVFNLTCEQPAASIDEDCLRFNPKNIEVKQVNSRWKIADGSNWISDFGDKADAARTGAAIIRHYNLNQLCYIGRPAPSFQYMLVSGQSPKGNAPQEDCISFDPKNIEVKQINSRWKIVDGSKWIFDFGNSKKEAEQAFAIVQKYGFTKSCYVGRPNPPMSYLRK